MNAENEEFYKLCKPLVEYLKEKHYPHCKIIITDSEAVLVEDSIGVIFK